MDGSTRSGPARYRGAWSAASLLIVVALVEYVVLPKLAIAGESLDRVTHLHPLWVIAAVALEAASLVSYSLFTRVLLTGSRVRFSWILRSDITGYGVSHVIPGGAATATALRFRLLVSGGALPTEVTATIAAEAIGSWLALVLMAWLTSIPALFLQHATSSYLLLFGIGLVALAGGVLAVRERSALERFAARLLRSLLQHLPRRVRPWIASVALRLRDLLADRAVRRAFLVWAPLNWFLDAAVLWTFLAAYGEPLSPVPLLLAYCVANLASALPLTPGGIAVVEGIAISTLIGFGVSAPTAVLAVLSWRLLQFWAPVPLAGACYLSLRAQSGLMARR
ncbi:lysylphosphatidylglycerol synthase transmembrane domain-containing protein [Kribbella sindirgiensis]|nr:YbhN family protein [Kribbella sindirgiensis]